MALIYSVALNISCYLQVTAKAFIALSLGSLELDEYLNRTDQYSTLELQGTC